MYCGLTRASKVTKLTLVIRHCRGSRDKQVARTTTLTMLHKSFEQQLHTLAGTQLAYEHKERTVSGKVEVSSSLSTRIAGDDMLVITVLHYVGLLGCLRMRLHNKLAHRSPVSEN